MRVLQGTQSNHFKKIPISTDIAADSKMVTVAVLIDLQQAFDTVDYKICFSNPVVEWFRHTYDDEQQLHL